MKTSNSYFATTAGAAGVCGCRTTGGESTSKEHHSSQQEGGRTTIHEWKPHPKSTAKPDFSSWPAMRTGTTG